MNRQKLKFVVWGLTGVLICSALVTVVLLAISYEPANIDHAGCSFRPGTRTVRMFLTMRGRPLKFPFVVEELGVTDLQVVYGKDDLEKGRCEGGICCVEVDMARMSWVKPPIEGMKAKKEERSVDIQMQISTEKKYKQVEKACMYASDSTKRRDGRNVIDGIYGLTGLKKSKMNFGLVGCKAIFDSIRDRPRPRPLSR